MLARALVRFAGLRKRFDLQQVLVSFAIGEGEVFGYIGPNSAGKTTTLAAGGLAAVIRVGRRALILPRADPAS
jgi:ABC-type uncharacterized transport system ATPase subunit